MDAFYLYLELVALTVLIWLCYDKFRPVVARPFARKKEAPAATKPALRRRPRMLPALPRSRRLRRSRSSLAR
jgi:hypothetical protein